MKDELMNNQSGGAVIRALLQGDGCVHPASIYDPLSALHRRGARLRIRNARCARRAIGSENRRYRAHERRRDKGRG
jgi:hypothetical protein